MESKKQIAAAIIQVMKAVKGMEKNSNVGTGNSSYNGTKDQDVKEVFNTALAEAGLCILPTDIVQETKIDRWEEKTNYGLKQKQTVFTKVVTKYLLLHTSGESIELTGYGHGVDAQDKGAGKATTYALKNCLLYTFLTPVGKIDDTETTHSNDIQTPTKPAPPKVQAKVETSEATASKLLEACKTPEELKKVFHSFTSDMQTIQEACKNKIKNKLTPNN